MLIARAFGAGNLRGSVDIGSVDSGSVDSGRSERRVV